jgi:hypothetical protein
MWREKVEGIFAQQPAAWASNAVQNPRQSNPASDRAAAMQRFASFCNGERMNYHYIAIQN